MNKTELNDEIEIITNAIEFKNNELANATLERDSLEIDEDEHEEAYIESLNCEGAVSVCGIEFDPSRILKELDPIAYRCGLSDFCQCFNIEDTAEYKELSDTIEQLEDELTDLEAELVELEKEEDEE